MQRDCLLNIVYVCGLQVFHLNAKVRSVLPIHGRQDVLLSMQNLAFGRPQ